ncbi:MAG TPA: FMN-binding protein [Chloroflexota bacterium]|nr:FMN-binding protein [Chloroflexota bacterium]
MPSHRMPRGLVALSASAVAAIYLAGYLRTQAADASIAAAAVPTLALGQSTPVVAVAPTSTPAPPIVRRQSQTSTRSPAAPAPAPTVSSGTTTQTAGGYKDGTYTGQGTSRRGDVWVSVQVQGGQIANVTITRSTLQYPLRDIASLPSEVVQRQSAQVDIVSRATYSSMAFRGAVTQALSAAHG